ncbi:protein ALP1-like isoform X2 [Macadamia integrifolia]|uniref:protein ALP1-like isoform X2 n=1 Tax=Macadamia integrifolia TaxID=60698 RepID=UPI001C530338|nr:protein ALP1-like isoform X2 [Macadamia integrifolia]
MSLQQNTIEWMMASALASTTAITVELTTIGPHLEKHSENEPPRNSYLKVRNCRNNETVAQSCKDMLRMTDDCFHRFVHIFRGTSRLNDTIHCKVEEQIAMFLHILGHNERNRSIVHTYERSGETVSRYFRLVLDVLLDMQDDFIRPPKNETPSYIASNNKWMPYFKDCIGAIDGTHIPVSIAPTFESRFKGPNQWPSQNVLAACDFDLQFTFVLSGWEGSASDSRVLASAISMEHGIVCHAGRYYLADAGFPLLKHFITPYRGLRYHLNDVRDRLPNLPKELFNHRHSLLRNVIERACGVLKKRFGILCSKPGYSYERQIDIVLACCMVHNHIRRVMPDDSLLGDVDTDLSRETPEVYDLVEVPSSSAEEGHEGSRIRNEITNLLWNDNQFQQCHG